MAPKSNFEVERDMLEVLEAAYTEKGRAGLGRSEGEPNVEEETDAVESMEDCGVRAPGGRCTGLICWRPCSVGGRDEGFGLGTGNAAP